jgi:hypothetical protein
MAFAALSPIRTVKSWRHPRFAAGEIGNLAPVTAGNEGLAATEKKTTSTELVAAIRLNTR